MPTWGRPSRISEDITGSADAAGRASLPGPGDVEGQAAPRSPLRPELHVVPGPVQRCAVDLRLDGLHVATLAVDDARAVMRDLPGELAFLLAVADGAAVGDGEGRAS
jgi:hypothetical protein